MEGQIGNYDRERNKERNREGRREEISETKHWGGFID